jgi:hypothetical protein
VRGIAQHRTGCDAKPDHPLGRGGPRKARNTTTTESEGSRRFTRGVPFGPRTSVRLGSHSPFAKLGRSRGRQAALTEVRSRTASADRCGRDDRAPNARASPYAASLPDRGLQSARTGFGEPSGWVSRRGAETRRKGRGSEGPLPSSWPSGRAELPRQPWAGSICRLSRSGVEGHYHPLGPRACFSIMGQVPEGMASLPDAERRSAAGKSSTNDPGSTET